MANVKEYTPESSIGQRLMAVQNLKAEIDRLTAELDDQKAYLLGHAIRQNYDGLRLGIMTLTRRERASWTYTPATIEAEAKLKARKTREQQTGLATNTPSEHLMINFSSKLTLQKIAQLNNV